MNTSALVTLRAMEPEDLDMLYRMENDTSLWSLGQTNVPYSRYVLHDYISQSSGDIYTDKQVRLVIENEEKETVGVADLTTFDPKNQRAEVGIVIMNRHRGKGYAAEAMRLLHHYAQATLHLHQVYAVVPGSNEVSLRLFHRLGYRQQGILGEWLFDGTAYHDAVLFQKILQNV